MLPWRWKSGDGKAFGLLLMLTTMYGILSYIAYVILHNRHITPLGLDAPLDRFSEARAVEHVRYLSVDIDGRQEGKPGLKEAARYIRREAEMMKARAGPGFSVMVEEMLVSGSFNMMFLQHSISLGYRNHTNIILRIQSMEYGDADPSLLVNGHFDGPLGSPAAGDCGSCVASMLETARLMIDSNWVPPRPVIFLFNGAEELFLLGSHGFMTMHESANKIGASINIEASGTGGPDLVCQSGPGSWPSRIYAESSIYPMAQSAAQDLFGIIPGDTDYRIFSQDFGNIPGLDIIFLLGGYFYHTSQDTVERLLPGSIQARGENLFSLIKAFTSTPMLQATEKRSIEVTASGAYEDRPVFFDYMSWFMIFYSRQTSLVLHSLPAILYFLLPFFLHFPSLSANLWFSTFLDLIKGTIFHIAGMILAIAIPVTFAIGRLLTSKSAMTWFAHPYLAFLMFVPCAVVGLLIPGTVSGFFSISNDVTSLKLSRKVLSEEACFWGAFSFYGFLSLVYLLSGLSGGFLANFISMSMVVAWFIFHLTCNYFGSQSIKSLAGYILPLIPTVVYSVYFGELLVQFLIEKMGMMGSLPQPYGYFVPDILVAATIGMVTGLCVGPLIPVAGHWLGRMSVLHFLLQVSVVALAISSQFFPYSSAAPKRVVLQHTFRTGDANRVVSSSYEFSVVDANSFEFLFKYAPDAAKVLKINTKWSTNNLTYSDQSSWVALFPVSFLFCGSLKFPVEDANIFDRYSYMPLLSVIESVRFSKEESRKVHVELYLGSLQEVWVAVLNITGPLSNWSFADNKLPAPETINGGPPSYICRLSGVSHENWTFWLEADSSEALRVDLAVLDQYLTDDTRKLKNLFPSWADVTAFSSYLSTYNKNISRDAAFASPNINYMLAFTSLVFSVLAILSALW